MKFQRQYLLMMPKKSLVSHTVQTRSTPDLSNTGKDLTESTGVVPAKDPPKVMSKESSNNVREYELQRNCAYLFLEGLWVFIVTQGQTPLLAEQVFSLWGRYSLMHVYSRIRLMLEFYKPGLIVCYKYFPFKVPWRPHNNGLDATWLFDLYMPRLSVPPPSCIIFPLQLHYMYFYSDHIKKGRDRRISFPQGAKVLRIVNCTEM